MNSREFAKSIGVSQATVSRALNNSSLVPEGKRLWIQAKAKEMGFVLNSSAKSLKTQRNNTIGILFPRHFVGMSENLMMAYLYDLIQNKLHSCGYDIMVVYYESEKDDTSNLERIIRMKKVDGFISLRLELTNRETQLINNGSFPYICIMNAASIVRKDINYVFSDSGYGGYLAGKFFAQFTNYQKVYVSVVEEQSDNRRRYNGFLNGLYENCSGMPQVQRLECNLSVRSGYECVMRQKEFFENKKLAIFCYCDVIALGMLNALKRLNLSVPEDIQIIGMHGSPLCASFHPKLSTIKVDADAIVNGGCDFLISQIANNNRINDSKIHQWVKPSLELNETTLNKAADQLFA